MNQGALMTTNRMAFVADRESSDESWIQVKDSAEVSSSGEGLTPKRDASLQRKEQPGSTTPLKRYYTHPVTLTKRREMPSGSVNQFESAFDRPMLEGSPFRATRTRLPDKQRVIVVSSDEDDSTDTDATNPPTRPASFRDDLWPSSQSSENSFFSSVPSISSIGSVKDMGPRKGHTTSRPQEWPVVARDVFSPVSKTAPLATTKAETIPSYPQPQLTKSTTQALLPKSVLQFCQSPFGTDLGSVIIAHSDEVQNILDGNRIAWGVQYELARGVCAGFWTWDAVRSQIHKLKGRNSEAAFKVERIMKGRDGSRPSDVHVWRQLDLEEDAILENIGRGLGLMGPYQGVPDWYGGKIQQLARVVKDEFSYKIKLEKLESRRSHRFARYYGSRRFLQVRVPEDLLQDERDKVKKFFRQKFILCGRVFVAFHAKEKNVYMVETNEDYGRAAQSWCGDNMRHAFNDFINWHNPLDVMKNTKQVISKYTARFALGLSNSTPALEFNEENIYFIDDITADDWPKGKKGAPADKLMTDGCGLLNHAALHAIVQTIGYDSIPAGVQGRIDGSKGFFILHPTDASTTPKIWIRDSQCKIKNRSFDRTHRIFDLLCASQPSPHASITAQSIVNLFANGIPDELLVQLMEEGLEEEVAPLLDWDKPHATLFLHNTISKCGGVSGVRAQRVSYALNRVLGFTGRDWHDDDGLPDEDDDDDDDDAGSYTGRNEYSGAPLALHEVAIELLQSGFHPRENKLLQEKIGYIIDSVIKTSVEKYRIPIPESIGAFIVPDPLGVLEEGEVFYRFSKPRKDPATAMLQYALEGEILLGRYPIRLPSDIQKVMGVYKRELDRWPDVLVVSIKGNRSVASLLADGDMDGDEIIGIYNKTIVNLFKSQNFTNPPPNFINDNFNRDVESVEQFCDRVATLSTRNTHEAFQDALVSNLSESRVGLYSMMHEKACIQFGYDSREAIRLAYIFATVLDSSKNGCRLKDGLLRKDLKIYGPRANSSASQHPKSSGMTDILQLLKSAGNLKGGELRQKYQDLGQLGDWEANDTVLRRPYEIAHNTAMKYFARGFGDFRDELIMIKNHVDRAYEEYKKSWRIFYEKKELKEESQVKKTKSRKEKNEDMMVECARKFAEAIPGLELIQNVEDIKASYGYVKQPKFAFRVAFRRLCLLKGEAMPGGLVPTLRIFDESKKVSSSYLKALEWADEDRLDLGPI